MSTKTQIPFEVGDRVLFGKTVTESEIFTFAGISGDYNPIHVNRAYAQSIGMKDCLAHGSLVFSIAAATEYILLEYGEKAAALRESGLTCLSYGYNRLRFIKPVYAGETITAVYEVEKVDQEERKMVSKLTATNQKGEIVFVADHILEFFEKKDNGNGGQD